MTQNLDDCYYSHFFVAFATLETHLLTSWLLSPCARCSAREMRVKEYSQLLESYGCMFMESLNGACGISAEFIGGLVISYFLFLSCSTLSSFASFSRRKTNHTHPCPQRTIQVCSYRTRTIYHRGYLTAEAVIGMHAEHFIHANRHNLTLFAQVGLNFAFLDFHLIQVFHRYVSNNFLFSSPIEPMLIGSHA